MTPPGRQSTSTTGYAITPVGPDDRAALCDLFRRSSVDTRYARFHHMVADFPHHYLADVTCTRCPHLALAARLSDGDMVGLASASSAGRDTAEIAVWVRDDWQHRDVGTTLVTELLHRLADAGLTSATAIISTTNTGARALIAKLAPHATTAGSTSPPSRSESRWTGRARQAADHGHAPDARSSSPASSPAACSSWPDAHSPHRPARPRPQQRRTNSAH